MNYPSKVNLKSFALSGVLVLTATGYGLADPVPPPDSSATPYAVSSLAPTPGTDDISQLTSTGYVAGHDPAGFGNFYTDYRTAGETFTTGSNALGYDLNRLSFQVGDAGNASGGPIIFSIYATFNTGANFDPTAPLLKVAYTGPAFSSGSWLTATLATPLVLDPNTDYAFGIKTGDQFGGNVPYMQTAYSTAQGPAGGSLVSLNVYSAQNQGVIDYPTGTYSLASNIGLTGIGEAVVPEPSTWMLLGLGMLGLITFHRKGRFLHR